MVATEENSPFTSEPSLMCRSVGGGGVTEWDILLFVSHIISNT